MTMIAVGQGLRGIANRGMSAVSRAETVEEQQRMGIEAQKQAAESQILGTGAGIGGMQGAKAAMDLRAANPANIERLNAAKDAMSSVPEIGSEFIGESVAASGDVAANLSITRDAAATGADLTGGINNISSSIEGLSQSTELLSTGTEVGGAINNVAGALEVGGAGAEAVAAGTELAAAGNAAAATGPMAQLSALAGPVAIGLGVAFLLNKLF
jgi:hypothetical protein